MSGILKAESMSASHTTKYLGAGNKVLATKMAIGGRGDCAQGTRNPEGVSELNAFVVAEVLFGDKVFRDVPVMHITGKNQLGFELMGADMTALGIRHIKFGGLSWDLFLDAAGLVNIFVLEIQNGIDAVLASQRTEAVLESPAGKNGAVTGTRLPLQIEFAGPAGIDAILKFYIRSKIRRLAVTRNPGIGLGFNFKVSWFFQMVIVGNKIRALLRPGRQRRQHE